MSPCNAMAPQFSESEAVSSFASFLVSVKTMERPVQPWDLIMSATMVLRWVQWHGSTRCFTLVEACTAQEDGSLTLDKIAGAAQERKLLLGWTACDVWCTKK